MLYPSRCLSSQFPSRACLRSYSFQDGGKFGSALASRELVSVPHAQNQPTRRPPLLSTVYSLRSASEGVRKRTRAAPRKKQGRKGDDSSSRPRSGVSKTFEFVTQQNVRYRSATEEQPRGLIG